MTFRLLDYVAIIVLTVSITSCSKNADGAKSSSIVGSWEWVRTDGGFAYHIHETPVTTGNKIELKMESNHKYFIFTNGILTSQGTYSLETKKCTHDHTDKACINFSVDRDMMIERVNKDSLELSDEAYDGIGSLYQRKQTDGHILH